MQERFVLTNRLKNTFPLFDSKRDLLIPVRLPFAKSRRTLRASHAKRLWKEVMRIGDHAAAGFNGAINGFFAETLIVPDLKLGIALAANTQMDVVLGIARSILEQVVCKVARVVAQQQTTGHVGARPDWGKYTGRYTMPGFLDVDIILFDGYLTVAIPAGSAPNSDVMLVP